MEKKIWLYPKIAKNVEIKIFKKRKIKIGLKIQIMNYRKIKVILMKNKQSLKGTKKKPIKI